MIRTLFCMFFSEGNGQEEVVFVGAAYELPRTVIDVIVPAGLGNLRIKVTKGTDLTQIAAQRSMERYAT